MGYEKVKRPLIAPSFTASTQLAANIWGSITLTGALKLPTESVSVGAADATLSRDGVTFLTMGTSGSGRECILQAPGVGGVGKVKHIFLINNTTSVDTNIHTNATANVFWGTTFNTANCAAASTGSPGGTPAGSAYLGLIAQSSAAWAVFPGSTFSWDFTATTGSTSIA